MKEELEKKLYEKYPQFFEDRTKPPTESLMCFGCDHGDGWFNIIESVCQLIDQHIKRGGWKHETPYKFSQIKEKFAGLRIYANMDDEYVRGVIDMSESMSFETCEICGEKGERYHSGMWVKTLCKKDADELGYKKNE